MHESSNCCEKCHDGNGDCVFPYYGLAPHKQEGKQLLGRTRITLEDTPPNFHPDKDDAGAGVYTHCLVCGSSRI